MSLHYAVGRLLCSPCHFKLKGVTDDFKPAGIDASRSGRLRTGDIKDGIGQVQVELPSIAQDGHFYHYQGQQTPATELECVLLWNEAEQCYVLHRLATITHLTHCKSAPPPLSDLPSPPAKRLRLSQQTSSRVLPTSVEYADSTPATPDSVEEFDMGSSSEEEMPLSAAARLPASQVALRKRPRSKTPPRVGPHPPVKRLEESHAVSNSRRVDAIGANDTSNRSNAATPQPVESSINRHADPNITLLGTSPLETSPAVGSRASSPFPGTPQHHTNKPASISKLFTSSRPATPEPRSRPAGVAKANHASPVIAEGRGIAMNGDTKMSKRRKLQDSSPVSAKSSDSSSDAGMDDEYRAPSASTDDGRLPAPRRASSRAKGAVPKARAPISGTTTTTQTTTNRSGNSSRRVPARMLEVQLSDEDDLDFGDLEQELARQAMAGETDSD